MSNCPKCKAPVLSERMLFHRCETTGYVDSGPTIWNSESARRLARYDEAVRLLERVRKHNQNWKELYAAIIDIQSFLDAEPKTDER